MIDHEKRIIFVHIAKTGGSSVTQFYGLCRLEECRQVENWGWEGKLNEVIYPRFNEPYSDGVHDSIERISGHLERIHGTVVSDYESFSVMRKPADYVRSCWNEWHTERFPDFENFITGNWFKGVINSQVRHHLMIDNHLAVDRLFTFEELPEVFQHIRDLTDYQDIPDIHANKKVHHHENNNVPEWLERQINEFFWEDYNFYETLRRNK